MHYLELPPGNDGRVLPFYLSMEEYAVRLLGERDDVDCFFFMWQVSPTVIVGRHQVIDGELDLSYCRSHDIAVYRRKSGGGCVFADRSNVMLSYITRGDNVREVYERYTAEVVEMLRALDLNATVSGRNDILVDGGKVSGTAFYHLNGCSIVHGTMLYDTDMSHMSHALTPSRAKLLSHGVTSVESRVTTLNRHLSMDIESFKAHMRDFLCSDTVLLGDDDLGHIERIMEGYLSPAFIFQTKYDKQVSDS